MLTLPASVRVFVARGATDLRRSFGQLYGIERAASDKHRDAPARQRLRQDPAAQAAA